MKKIAVFSESLNVFEFIRKYKKHFRLFVSDFKMPMYYIFSDKELGEKKYKLLKKACRKDKLKIQNY